MKEATGELNATIVVIVAVGVLMAFFYYTLWPIISSSFIRNSSCGKAVCDLNNVHDGYVDCYPKGKYGIPSEKIECVYKG